MRVIDLGSDTVTHPTEEMREAMRRAELGDDGRAFDPTVRRLEEMAAERLGKEAGVFLVSGTMGNLVAQLAHTGRGGQVLLEANAHILRSEMGGIATLAGLFHKGIPGERGAMDLAALEEAIVPRTEPNRLATALITMETTHNDAGGAVLPLAHMGAVHALGQRHSIPVHTDGARVFNAAIKLGVPAAAIARHTESITFCISKGLSCPVGAVLCGGREFITRARAFRRMVGGNLRQGGVIAAAGIVALDRMVDRLAEDHANARRLAEGLARIDPSLVDLSRVETNILQLRTQASGRPASEWVAALKESGILSGVWSKWVLRLVTHPHIGEGEVEETLATVRRLWAKLAQKPAAAE